MELWLLFPLRNLQLGTLVYVCVKVCMCLRVRESVCVYVLRNSFFYSDPCKIHNLIKN